MDFEARLASHYRLAILLSLIEEPAEERLRFATLRVMARIPGRSATASQVEDLLPAYGHQVTRAEVVAVLSWLHRSRLVKMNEDEGVIGALLLDLGRDVAGGRATVPGVAPASTQDWLLANLEAKSIRLGRSALAEHVIWCMERKLVTDDGAQDVEQMLFATGRGHDVALGRDEVEGVKAPSTSTILRLASNAARDRLGG